KSQRSLSITLYEGKYFTGRKLEVCGNCDNFQDRGFMNQVNSICVQSGQYVLEHGEYPDFYRWNGYNDHMGSCRPVGMVSANFRLVSKRFVFVAEISVGGRTGIAACSHGGRGAQRNRSPPQLTSILPPRLSTQPSSKSPPISATSLGGEEN
uniref:Beta/gamma crystallin 'Greek key' domain-containing protein n=1 Tax=Gopherus agassizii TaxID=38772 RepID=A0A452GRS3_9SAUR